MKVIYNKLIPFKGFKAMMLFGLLFVREGVTMSETDMNHEKIHTAQMKEMLGIIFYIWYLIEWLIRLPKGNAYRNISFEREAYANQGDFSYLNGRRWFNFLKYIK